MFVSYPRGSLEYTVGVVVNKTAEAPFPASGPVVNLPPSQLNTSVNGIDFGSSNITGLISVQPILVTSAYPQRPETLWLIDTGRPTIYDSNNSPSMPYAQPGGPKMFAINITSNDGQGAGGSHNDTVYATYTFPPSVHYPDSMMNDVRIDLRTDLPGTSGKGIAYITDSSNEGRTGFIMVDLGTGESWRRLDEDSSVQRVNWNVPSYQGVPFYFRQKGKALTSLPVGNDGLQLSADGSRMYYSPLTSTTLYSIPTVNLRARDTDPLAELAAHSNVSDHGQRGADANGFEGDDQGRIYQCMPTQNAIYYYDPNDLQTHGFARDPRIVWPDGASVGEDGYIYVQINQLFFQGDWNDGVDTRTKPGAILRAKLPNGARKQRLG